jgi:mono/diheme cytochrome c family protein
VVVIHKGANYGYPLREGTQSMSPTNGMGVLPQEDTIPVQISDTVSRGTVKPAYPVVQYPHDRETGGDAIANGFIYRGTLLPALRSKLVFGDITTGRIWYADRSDVLAADDGDATTVAPIYEVDTDLRRITQETFRERGGKGDALPGMGIVAGRGRVDLRFAVDNDGELYILTKGDGMIRKVVGAKPVTAPTTAAKNPVPSTPESFAAGKRSYEANCAACHGPLAEGAIKAGMAISIIEEQRGRQPPDLTDDQSDYGSSEAEVFTVIKRGLPPTMMPGFDGRIPDDEIRSIVNYLRTLSRGRSSRAPRTSNTNVESDVRFQQARSSYR